MEKVTRGYELFSKRLKMLEKSRKASPSADFVIEATAYNFSLTFALAQSLFEVIISDYYDAFVRFNDTISRYFC